MTTTIQMNKHNKYPAKFYAMSFDIEKLGSHEQFLTCAIGASFWLFTQEDAESKPKGKEIDYFFGSCMPDDYDESMFEPRCWNEFWKNKTDFLDNFAERRTHETEDEMHEAFLDYMRDCWKTADDEGCELLILSDCAVYDGGFVNDWIMRAYPDTTAKDQVRPLPYSPYDNSFENLIDVSDVAKGICMSKGLENGSKTWGCLDALEKIYELPEKSKELKDHWPEHDSYRIAWQYWCCLLVAGDFV